MHHFGLDKSPECSECGTISEDPEHLFTEDHGGENEVSTCFNASHDAKYFIATAYKEVEFNPYIGNFVYILTP